jgi:hypothetical protein
MSNSTSLLAYPDVKEALERALATTKGVRVRFQDGSSAFRFVARCNSFRLLDRKENLKIYLEPAHSLHGRSVYDVLAIRRSEDNFVTIEPVRLEAGVMEDL